VASLVERQLGERAVVGDPRVRDEHVDGAEPLDRGGHRLGVRHVGHDRHVAVTGELARELLEWLEAPRHQPDGRAASSEGAGDRLADAARGAGHEDASTWADLHSRGC
jgi:hypothetical protein